MFTLISKNQTRFQIPKRLLEKSITLSFVFEYDKIGTSYDLNSISDKTLILILLFLIQYDSTQYFSKRSPLISADYAQNGFNEFDFKLVAPLSFRRLLKLLRAVNYLNIPELIDLVSAAIAIRLYGKNIDEINSMMI